MFMLKHQKHLAQGGTEAPYLALWASSDEPRNEDYKTRRMKQHCLSSTIDKLSASHCQPF